jgi:hypothetical protein
MIPITVSPGETLLPTLIDFTKRPVRSVPGVLCGDERKVTNATEAQVEAGAILSAERYLGPDLHLPILH